MEEKFENKENIRIFSEEQVRETQNLIRNIREVLEWDFGKMCGTTDELDMVNRAKDAMQEVGELFHIPKTKFWAEMAGDNMQESIKMADEYNRKPLPSESITFNSDNINKLTTNLKDIGEILNWDIKGEDETEISMIERARESFEKLNNLFI